MLLLGAGMGVAFVPLTMTSLAGVAPEDSGAAASMVNVMQQVGGALGLSILVTVVRRGQPGRSPAPAAPRHRGRPGPAHAHPRHVVAFTVAAAFDLAALLVTVLVIRGRAASPAPAPAAAPVETNTVETNTEETDAEELAVQTADAGIACRRCRQPWSSRPHDSRARRGTLTLPRAGPGSAAVLRRRNSM